MFQSNLLINIQSLARMNLMIILTLVCLAISTFVKSNFIPFVKPSRKVPNNNILRFFYKLAKFDQKFNLVVVITNGVFSILGFPLLGQLGYLLSCEDVDECKPLHKCTVALAQQAGVSSNIKPYITSNPGLFAATGSLLPSNPWILVGKEWAESATPSEFIAVVSRELWHIKSNNMLKRLITTVLFMPVYMMSEFPFILYGCREALRMLRNLIYRSHERKADLFAADLVGVYAVRSFIQK